MRTSEPVADFQEREGEEHHETQLLAHVWQETDALEIERHLQRTTFSSGGTSFELVYFEEGKNAPNLLISQGSGGHAYVFAELGYQMYLRGYNVFIMPKQGGFPT